MLSRKSIESARWFLPLAVARMCVCVCLSQRFAPFDLMACRASVRCQSYGYVRIDDVMVNEPNMSKATHIIGYSILWPQRRLQSALDPLKNDDTLIHKISIVAKIGVCGPFCHTRPHPLSVPASDPMRASPMRARTCNLEWIMSLHYCSFHPIFWREPHNYRRRKHPGVAMTFCHCE